MSEAIFNEKERTQAKWVNYFSLFTSSGTLICCALPALMVSLGLGASLVGLLGKFPQLIWLSAHKYWIFGIGAGLLAIGGFLQWQVRNLPCPADKNLAEACTKLRRRSLGIYIFSVVIYLVGFSVSFVLPNYL